MGFSATDHLLTTTRSVRKRLDFTRPVEPEIIQECLDIAIQAPTGSNAQGWYFMVITDPERRAQIAALYKKSWDVYITERSRPTPAQRSNPGQMGRVSESAQYLADHLSEVPVFIIPCIEGRVEQAQSWMQASLYGSILPATWSLMLALRSRGLGSSWTTLHIRHEREAAASLGIPDTITQAALLPVAYYTGDDFKPAERQVAQQITFWNSWGSTKTKA